MSESRRSWNAARDRLRTSDRLPHMGSSVPPPTRNAEPNTERLGLDDHGRPRSNSDATPVRRGATSARAVPPPPPPPSRSAEETSPLEIDQAMVLASEAFLGRDESGQPAPADADLDLSIEIETQEPVFEGGPEDVTSRAYETATPLRSPELVPGPDLPGPVPPGGLDEISSSAIELVADAQLPPNARRAPRARTNGQVSVPPPSVQIERQARSAPPNAAGGQRAAPHGRPGSMVEGAGRRIPAKRPMTRPRMPAIRVGSTIGSPNSTLIPDPAAHARPPTMFPLEQPPLAPPSSRRPYIALGAAVLAVLVALGVVAKVNYDQQAASTQKMEALQAQLVQMARENEARLAEVVQAERARAEAARQAEADARRRAEAEAARKIAARREAARRAREAASASRAAKSAGAVEDRQSAERRASEARRLAEKARRDADEAAKREQEERSRAVAEAQRREAAELREAEAERKRRAEQSAGRAAEEKARAIASRSASDSDAQRVPDEPIAPRSAERSAAPSGSASRRPSTPGSASRRPITPGSVSTGAVDDPVGSPEGGAGSSAPTNPNLSGRTAAVPVRCPKGMVFLQAGRFMLGTARNDPERNFGDLDSQPVEVDAFCVDYYEYPNRRGNMPRTQRDALGGAKHVQAARKASLYGSGVGKGVQGT